jgi:hypothetical protein
MYVQGYLQGSENGRVVTIGSRFVLAVPFILPTPLFVESFIERKKKKLEFYFKFISILHTVNNVWVHLIMRFRENIIRNKDRLVGQIEPS